MLDKWGGVSESHIMHSLDVKSELKTIAEQLPDTASYADAMYQLYVRMKVAAGRLAVDQGRIVPHEAVKGRFAK